MGFDISTFSNFFVSSLVCRLMSPFTVFAFFFSCTSIVGARLKITYSVRIKIAVCDFFLAWRQMQTKPQNVMNTAASVWPIIAFLSARKQEKFGYKKDAVLIFLNIL